VVNVNRQQIIAIGALTVLLLVCAVTVGLCFQVYSETLQEYTDRRDMLARLEAAPRSRVDSLGRSITAGAPAGAFLGASTQGIAAAQLQSYIARVAADRQAILISSGVDAARQDSPDLVRVQAMMDLPSKALQGFLFQLESGIPYVFVESLKIVPSNAAAQVGIQDPTLRVTLTLRALWRRDAV
jgi:general secretion pathway protein M